MNFVFNNLGRVAAEPRGENPPAADPPRRRRAVVVVKLGGSVLTNAAAYRRSARFLKKCLADNPAERLIAVVSARFGVTDRLERLARRMYSAPHPRTLDLLWHTGELRSVALLTLCLQALGVSALGLNVHEAGLRRDDSIAGTPRWRLQPLTLRRACARHDVIVVPGFFAQDDNRGIISLGRGGSDLSAVLLAVGLSATRCELIKDVPGYFDRDPNVHADARPLPRLSFEQALAMAAEGCDLVQPRALEFAAETKTRLLVRGLEENGPRTRIESVPAGHESGIRTAQNTIQEVKNR